MSRAHQLHCWLCKQNRAARELKGQPLLKVFTVHGQPVKAAVPHLLPADSRQLIASTPALPA